MVFFSRYKYTKIIGFKNLLSQIIKYGNYIGFDPV